MPVALLTVTAMAAFAANSVLCRMALGADLIDAASFTSLRLMSGTLCLLFIVRFRSLTWRPSKPNWLPALALCAYMVCFSFAYQSLTAGTGALLLFGCVQLTMIGTAVCRGERLSILACLGMLIAGCGLVYLVFPGLAAPDPKYSALMASAGLAWGVYSLYGSRGEDPTSATANNFLYATPVALVVSIAGFSNLHFTWPGAVLAVISGAVTSALGYAIWYAALKRIDSTTAATLQLSVPALATLGGVLVLAEPLTLRIVLATLLTIGGIAISLKPPQGSS